MTADRDTAGIYISRSLCNVGARNECHDASDWNNDIFISFSRSSPCRRNTPSTYSSA